MTDSHIQRLETVLFVGAGATAALKMPTTYDQAIILWKFCDSNEVSPDDVAKSAKCFASSGEMVSDMLQVLDCGFDGCAENKLDDDVRGRVFPKLEDEQVRILLTRLRQHYDWGALKLVAAAKKGSSNDESPRDEYLQEVFTLIDVCIRDERGFMTYLGDRAIFLSVQRLKAARETLVLLINTAFACAWMNLISTSDAVDKENLKKYRDFFYSLGKMMQTEGERFLAAGCKQNLPEFYQFSYSLVTTNFEPVFLWLIWNAHDKVNHESEVRLGNPGRTLKLLMNFPNSIGMRKPVEDNGDHLANVWFPCTDAVAQNANNPKYCDNRIFRLGKYYAVHGMTNTRHCPVCGKLNLYLGDSWDENSETLFPNGVIHSMCRQAPRTLQEKNAFDRGEYDALECHFCGAITHAYDNFMFMQTQLKTLPPSFIKETTDEALSVIAGAKHIVLLGYSLPLDDAIWGSLLTTMSRRPQNKHLYCTVVDCIKDETREWLSGDDLDDYVLGKRTSRAIKNAVAVFGRANVRAYTQGVPNVFGSCSEKAVRELIYPECATWKIPEFTSVGVIRKG